MCFPSVCCAARHLSGCLSNYRVRDAFGAVLHSQKTKQSQTSTVTAVVCGAESGHMTICLREGCRRRVQA